MSKAAQSKRRAAQIDDQLAVVLRTKPASHAVSVELGKLAATLHHQAGGEEESMFAW
jgi:hypothetical protein